ncbi:hypothetical protein C8Q76DRAFT_803164 [Earliella scabrosa]|nr:hypothetical protein C8Q76DRAFT_803164 [Earliella scabrosa]
MSYKYTLFSSLALLLYDITITLETEIQVVWRRRPNLGSFLHVINRYGEIGAYATAAVLLFPVTDRTYVEKTQPVQQLLILPCDDGHRCPIVGIIEEVFTLLPYIAWALFSGIRIHALSEGNVALAALVVVLNASYILPDVYTYSSMQFVNYPYPSGCTRIYNDDSVLYSRFQLKFKMTQG